MEPLAQDEILDIVDEHDRVIGQAPRRRVYAERLCHRAVFVLVRNGAGEIFVHRRTARKLVFPSMYDMFVGGVLGTGEAYDVAAQREAAEELGVPDLPAPEFRLKFCYETPEHTWWSALYEVRYDGPVRPQESEVAWHAFLTEDELHHRIAEWDWVPDGLAAYRRLTERPARQS